MSYKVYDAYRFKDGRGRLNKFLESVDEQLFANVAKRFDAEALKHLCEHPQERVTAQVVFVKGDSFEVGGECGVCGLRLRGVGKPAEGVTPFPENGKPDYSAVMSMIRSSKESPVAVDVAWERPVLALPPRVFGKDEPESAESLAWRRRYAANNIVLNNAKRAAESTLRDYQHDLECGVTLRLLSVSGKQYWYARLFGEDWTHEGVKFPEWAEEYHYQNSTDPPRWARRGNGKALWEQRQVEWDQVVEKGPAGVPLTLVHYAVSFQPGTVASEAALSRRGAPVEKEA